MTWHDLCWWRPPCVLRSVIVNTIDEETAFRGVLWRSRGAWLVLRQAELLKPQTDPTHIDGDIVVHRDRVAFIQVLP